MGKYSAITILRWGLAFTFFYAAIAGLLNPENWIGYLPPFASVLLPPRITLALFSVYEMILAVFLFAGRRLRWAALFSAITLTAITLFNLEIFEVTFRDVGLTFAALALCEMAKNESKRMRQNN